MNIEVRARPGANEEKIEKLGEESFEVWVKEPPLQGQANRAIAKVLAEYFGVPTSSVSLVSGFRAKQKRFAIKSNEYGR